MQRNTRMKTAGAVAAVALLAAACGSEDGSGGSDDPLQLGYILPESGPLAFLGPPQIQGVLYAVSEINASGGVLGNELPTPVSGDEAGDAAVANQSADNMISGGVHAVIGAASSSMSLAVIEKLTGEEIVQCSGSNTAPTFTDFDDNGGFYIRTAPSDALQGPVLAKAIADDGHSTVAITAQSDDYGRGLANALEEALGELDIEVTVNDSHDPNASNFNGNVQAMTSTDADAYVVIAFEQGTQIIQGLIEGGHGPADGKGLYGADGLRSEGLPALVDAGNPNVLDGMKGTTPSGGDSEAFLSGFAEFRTDSDTTTTYAAQVYDCVHVIALAAEAAESTNPADFVSELINVTTGGTECSSFAECRDLLADGEDINYQGVSGPVDFSDAGEPAIADIEIWEFSGGGTLSTVEVVTQGEE